MANRSWIAKQIEDAGYFVNRPAESSRQDLEQGIVVMEGGLRIFGDFGCEFLPSISAWNGDGGWRSHYGNLAEGLEAFAEDAFGNQFAWKNSSVIQFMAESGAVVPYAASQEEWLKRVLSDPDEELSLWLLNEWAAANGRLPFDCHLCAIQPFVLGGEGVLTNLYSLSREKSIAFKGSLALQIHDLPPGSKVRIKVIH